jgi:flavin reductase
MDSLVFREGMSRLAGAVCIITTRGMAGEGGFTATAVCSVTDSPPTLLVCMNAASYQASVFLTNDRLCVNVLAGNQDDVSRTFAKSPRDVQGSRFDTGLWFDMPGGCPGLEGAVANFEGIIKNRQRVGSHLVMFCEIDTAELQAFESSLVYLSRGYCSVQAPA